MRWLLPLVFLGLAGCGRQVLPPQRAEACLARVREAYEAGRFNQVPSRARPLIKAHPRTPGSEEALFLAADAEDKRGRPTAAYKLYETLIREHPASGRIQDVSRREFALASTRYAQGKRRLKGHVMTFGAPLHSVFEASARHDPYADHAAYALLLAATCQYDDAFYEEALDILSRLASDHPRSPWLPQAEFLRAMTAYRLCKGASYDLARLRTAEEGFQGLLRRWPAGQDVDAARRMLVVISDRWAEHGVRAARVYEKLKRPGSAELYYRDVVEHHSDSPWAEEARHALAH
jgi:outer membrane protein assembly factor BamD